MVDFMQYEDNPDSPETLLTFSNELANDRLHNLSVLIAERGLERTVDHTTRTKLLEQISISGFYTKGPDGKKRGKEACEELALDRKNSWHTKNLARQNSTYYARSLSSLLPKTECKPFVYTPPDDYKPMNPSITNKGSELWMIQRTVNYVIRPDGSYNMRGDSAIRTRNYLCQLDEQLQCVSAREILPPLNLPPAQYGAVIGWEDCRLFYWNDSFWCTSTVRELNAEGYCEIVLSKIIEQDGFLYFSDYCVIQPQFCGREHQKNWMPMVVGTDLYFMYSSDPARIIDVNGNLISSKATHIAADSFRGGSQLLPFNGGWLAIIHESHIMPDNKRRYMHRLVWYDNIGRLSKYSEAFFIHTLGIEFAAGLAFKKDSGQIVISFGLADKESWVALIDENELCQILQPAGVILPRLGDLNDTSWIISQTNRSLLDSDSVSKATGIALRAGISSHEDAAKNWDNLVAVWHATMTTDIDSPVMDVAATEGSAFLPALERFGYQHLFSINIDEPNPRTIGKIHYQHGDCTNTSFEDNYFGFISCLSVIEHGVDIQKFMQESARILKSGGYLLVSTDYWQDTVDTFGQTAFGSPVKVFTAQEIAELINFAQSAGLQITSNVDLTCNERVVNWIGMDYTFINLLFRKP